jgi:hypothetical protein
MGSGHATTAPRAARVDANTRCIVALAGTKRRTSSHSGVPVEREGVEVNVLSLELEWELDGGVMKEIDLSSCEARGHTHPPAVTASRSFSARRPY